ncbi:MAG: FAD-linked oxidase C-terminal domain-containing protein [Mariniblastus sp.]|nr:FAD-linked oxidase C-terminal domain-containing protein [Mariniblastus sp.]
MKFAEAVNRLAPSFQGELHLDPTTRKVYATDASVYQEIPAAVAIPKTVEDLQRLIQLAHQTGVGLIPRTAGTSLAGQVVGPGIIVDVSRHFTRIMEINRAEKWVRVQPGVVRDELNLVLSEQGLMFGPETSTSNRAMIGGMVGNNSCGSNSIVYGSTREQTIEIQGLLSDGSLATLGPLDVESLSQLAATEPSTLADRIIRQTYQMLKEPSTQQEIFRQFPKPSIHRRNTGYALDQLIQCDAFGQGSEPFNPCRLIAGSEGTLMMITEIKLRCHELPPPEAAVQCAHFNSVHQALQATRIAMRFQPYACELIDQLIIEGARRNIGQSENLDFVQGQPAAILVTQLRGDTVDGVAKRFDELKHELVKAGLGTAYPVLSGTAAQRVWSLRKAGLGVVSNAPGDDKPVAVVEDTAVDLADLPAYIAEFDQQIQEQYGVTCVHYAHAGSGELHLRPVLNLKQAGDVEKFRQIATDVAQLVQRYRGSLSGEHGDGRLRAEFIEAMVGKRVYQWMRQIKQIWDPQNVFNPHRIVDPPPMDEQLRFQIDQDQKQPATVFDFQSTGGMLGAAELCSGSGDCRKTAAIGGTMCPSYMATRNEMDTTRARANLLRQSMTGQQSPAAPFDQPEVKQVLDLCLSCKGCKRECPSNVDMAKLKSEFLQGYYDLHGIPWRTRLMAANHVWNHWASKAPWLYHLATQTPGLSRWVKRLAGCHPDRSIPRISSPTVGRWFKKRRPHPNAGKRGSVWLFVDEFTDYLDAPVGRACIELLEKLGYAVDIPPHTASGRASISMGLLRQARQLARTNVEQLAGKVTAEKPLIGLEPSAILSFRDEYPDLVGEDYQDKARLLAKNVFMVEEFLNHRFDQGDFKRSAFSQAAQTIRLHGHCHQKATAQLAPTVKALQLPLNYHVRLIASGCCGMAGAFGYEMDKYELSMQIGELVLFPAIRQEPEEHLIAASGTSCRHQILDGTGRKSWHPVEILNRAMA